MFLKGKSVWKSASCINVQGWQIGTDLLTPYLLTCASHMWDKLIIKKGRAKFERGRSTTKKGKVTQSFSCMW